jgi:hypothetical protein
MGETPDQIERHIYEKRHELGENIHELQHKVKRAVDWREQTYERPWTMVGLAFGVGLLSSWLIAKRRRSRGKSYRWQRPERWTRGESVSRSEYRREREAETSETWETIKSAVAAMAVTAAKDFVRQIIPGFRERYRGQSNVERRKPNGSADTPWHGPERRRSGPEYVHS